MSNTIEFGNRQLVNKGRHVHLVLNISLEEILFLKRNWRLIMSNEAKHIAPTFARLVISKPSFCSTGFDVHLSAYFNSASDIYYLTNYLCYYKAKDIYT